MKLLICTILLSAAIILTLGRPEDQLTAGQQRRAEILAEHSDIDPQTIVEIDGDVYFIESSVKVSALEATQICNELGFRLVTLETEQKNLKIREYLTNETLATIAYWTGGQKYLNTWQWSGIGQLFNYTDWFSGQPDYAGSDNAVLAMYGNNGWFDYPHTLQFSFICE